MSDQNNSCVCTCNDGTVIETSVLNSCVNCDDACELSCVGNGYVAFSACGDDKDKLGSAAWTGIGICIAVWIVLGVVGAVYTVRIIDENVPMNPSEKGWDIASVIIGWLIPPLCLVNISSPISYAVHAVKK